MKYTWIDEYFLSKKGVVKDFKEEWNAHRFLLAGKMVAMLGEDKEKNRIISLKCEPLYAEHLREEYPDIKPGYYMNKQHWNSIYLDGEVPDDVLKNLVDMSYRLIFESLSKKNQKEIMEEEND